ncbi:hypothetical protein ML462_03535 [Gramella lutea]|uniref:Uncharacterized protein n=1 Tax=Christiangramia lutea TaxID=1607951 RepID=A0A9X2A9K6_9FLAO|nr:hypothetical protein [Christiangramia lutea]MCH4822236.1 hypothetical protein [Christiangramia lutea]
MKKLFFYLFIIIAIVLLVQILKILILDLPKLTPYGYGYLGGKVILFFLFLGFSYLIRRNIKGSKTRSKRQIE